MELQATGNQGITNRSAIAKFVHDVADMEVRVFTLRRAAKRIRKDAQKKKEALEAEACNRKFELDRINGRLGTARGKRYDETEKLKFHWVKKLFAALGIGIGVGFGIWMFLGIISVFGEVPSWIINFFNLGNGFGSLLILSLLIWLVTFIMSIILHAFDVKDTISPNILGFTTEINTLEKELQTVYQSLLNAQAELQKFESQIIPKLSTQADSLEKDAKLIEEKLRQCYELDIVKPSYRKLVCVVILDEIFTNDKADTMREAMLLCDTEIRHAELIGKLDEVIHSLKTLASTLQYMTHVLENINSNVSLISQDVYRIAESQDRIAYATESIKQSAANADYYIEQKRMGVL
ncbi:MAG: hypothetical protein J6D87_04520 [Clostridia bacterium]|nr:hypothetical protein [Clostridia bacterium]